MPVRAPGMYSPPAPAHRWNSACATSGCAEEAHQVRYVSNNPHALERQPYACPDADTLGGLLHHCGAETGAITQAYAELGKGRMTVMLVALSPAQMRVFFRPMPTRAS